MSEEESKTEPAKPEATPTSPPPSTSDLNEAEAKAKLEVDEKPKRFLIFFKRKPKTAKPAANTEKFNSEQGKFLRDVLNSDNR